MLNGLVFIYNVHVENENDWPYYRGSPLRTVSVHTDYVFCQVRWVKNSPAKWALWNFSQPYLTKFFV